jgi:hypothetical protein
MVIVGMHFCSSRIQYPWDIFATVTIKVIVETHCCSSGNWGNCCLSMSLATAVANVILLSKSGVSLEMWLTTKQPADVTVHDMV